MASVLVSCAVDREFEQGSCRINDYEIGRCCFSARYATLRRKSKDWSVRNQNGVTCVPTDCCFSGLAL
jgi:hypothetical protein